MSTLNKIKLYNNPNVRIGQKVKGKTTSSNYKGTIVALDIYNEGHKTYPRMHIKRDDKKTGGGTQIPEYGRAWLCWKINGTWMSDASHGDPLEFLD